MASPRLLENAPLLTRNTFRVTATAPLLAEVPDRAALDELLRFETLLRMPLLVLGQGSNLLLAGDPPGLVLHLDLRGIAVVREDADGALVRAEAGVVWNEFVHYTLGRRLEGLENLALIPGHVGAAPIQNIGAYGAEVGQFIETVEAFDRASGRVVRLDNAACGFAYRDSVFKRQPERWIVIAVEFRLPRQHELQTAYAGIAEELAAMGVTSPRAAHVAEAVIRLRTRKLPDPALIGNAGSFFKNPQVDAATAQDLLARNPRLPVYSASTPGQHKLSAGWLIDACGWKGFREGDAGISDRHALVLVNHGQASGTQLLDLARRVAASVHDRFGVTLEPEPRIVGASW
ncbi:MAG: UDP-N-acetylmuramate dehydrogenase [Proteobacteria bacterium]|nr:UDP-N-acetylmuramate dehydrogenase [Pseudomonadota bacterium]